MLFPEGMFFKNIAGKKENKSGVKKEEGIVKSFRNCLGKTAGDDAVVVGHGGGNDGACEGGKAQVKDISWGEIRRGEFVFYPVADDKVEGGFADGEKRIKEAVHFSRAFKNEEGENGDDAYKE